MTERRFDDPDESDAFALAPNPYRICIPKEPISVLRLFPI